MKKFRILMGAMVLAMVAATVIACSKEKETKVAQQTTENNERKPIATYDNATGQMTYHVSVEQLQKAMDDHSMKKNVDEYVVESWQITEEENEIQPVFRYTLINTDTESSSSTALFGSFVERVVGENHVDYFLAEDIASGNYAFVAKDGAVDYQITVVDGEVSSVVELGQAKGYTAQEEDKYMIECKKIGPCINEYPCWATRDGCTPCEPDPKNCEQTISLVFSAVIMMSIIASN